MVLKVQHKTAIIKRHYFILQILKKIWEILVVWMKMKNNNNNNNDDDENKKLNLIKNINTIYFLI